MLKQSTRIKNKEGYSNAIAFLESAVIKHHLTLKEYTRVIKKLNDFISKDPTYDNEGKKLFWHNVHTAIGNDSLNIEYIEIHLLYSEFLANDDISNGIKYLKEIIENNSLEDYEFKSFYFR